MSEPEVFCDFLTATGPIGDWPDVRSDLVEVLDMAGLQPEFSDEKSDLWRHGPSEGTVKCYRQGSVFSLGVSGAACAVLRSVQMFGEYLGVISKRPHRVTRLDAACDVEEDACEVVDQIKRRGYAGELSLTRKSIKPHHVRAMLGRRPDGAESGTVYCGSRSAEARMCVYDKSLERFQKRGEWSDDAPLVTRYELRLGKVGATLRDAYEPDAVFWHHASPDFLQAPASVRAWVPNGEGFTLPPRDVPLPAQRLVRRVDTSSEVASLLDLASASGPYGFDLLVSRLKARMPSPAPPAS